MKEGNNEDVVQPTGGLAINSELPFWGNFSQNTSTCTYEVLLLK